MKTPRLERYLKEATQGLTRTKRAEVARELRGNVEQHVLDRMTAGVGQARALEEVLDDFGAPSLVSRGMWGVHMKPVWARIVVGVGLSSVLGLSLLSASAEPVRILPSQFVNIDDVFNVLGWSNGRVEVKGKEFGIYRGEEELLLKYYEQENGASSGIVNKEGQRYISPHDVFFMLSRYKESFVNFDIPSNSVSVGGKILSLTKDQNSVDIRYPTLWVTQAYLHPLFKKYIGQKYFVDYIRSGAGYQHYIRGGAKPKHPYLLLWSGWEKPTQQAKTEQPTIRLGILNSDQNGDFRFETVYREVYFAHSWETLKNMKRNQVLVVEMTGRINPLAPRGYDQAYQEIINPSSILQLPVSIGQKVR